MVVVRRLVLLALLGILAVLGGPVGSGSHGSGTVQPALRTVASSACGPLAAGQVIGNKPDYLPSTLTRFWGDDAVCRGRWLGGDHGRFVPQSVDVDRDFVWVSGYDGSSDVDGRICWVYQLARPSLRVVTEVRSLSGRLRDGTTITCHHAGGIVSDGPRLWVSDTTNLFLLKRSEVGSPSAVKRVWRLGGEVRGSTSTLHPVKGLGLGRYAVRGEGRVDWYDVPRMLASTAETLYASGTEPAPNGLQGMSVGALSPEATRATWKTLSGSRCTVLLGPGGRRIPVTPGVEGLAFDGGGGAWMLSESSARTYYDSGDPVVPQLLRYSRARLAEQASFEAGRRRADNCLDQLA